MIGSSNKCAGEPMGKKEAPQLDIAAALEAHFLYWHNPTREEWNEFVSELEMAAAKGLLVDDPPDSPPRRGRPSAADSKDRKTLASYSAGSDAVSQMQAFRRRNNVDRLPGTVMEAIIQDVMSTWPNANEEVVREYIRENRKYFPD